MPAVSLRRCYEGEMVCRVTGTWSGMVSVDSRVSKNWLRQSGWVTDWIETSTERLWCLLRVSNRCYTFVYVWRKGSRFVVELVRLKGKCSPMVSRQMYMVAVDSSQLRNTTGVG